MLYQIGYYFLLFFIYSVLGWVIESACVSIIEKKIVLNRGFLLGPYCPIFGVSALVMILFLKDYANDFVVLFVMSMVLCTAIEYFTSVILEKLFKARWWNYKDKKFNIDGRVCLENAVLFGVLGVLVMKAVNPFFVRHLSALSSTALLIIAGIIFVLFFIDFIISTVVISKLRKNVVLLSGTDETNQITNQVRERIKKNASLKRRLINAFPSATADNLALRRIRDILNKHRKIKK